MQSAAPHQKERSRVYAQDLMLSCLKPAVTSHEAWGLGSYCFFNRNPTVVADHAFEVPVALGVRLRNMVTVSLGGGRGAISHVINQTGGAARSGATVQKLVIGP